MWMLCVCVLYRVCCMKEKSIKEENTSEMKTVPENAAQRIFQNDSNSVGGWRAINCGL